MPFFSVVIPTYNREQVIKKAIDSVMNQTFTDFEIIISDDGSTDGTFKVIENLNNDKILYFFQPNKGVCAARNSGVRNAKGEYLVFLDSDDYVKENWLMDFYEEAQKSKSDIIRCNTVINGKENTDNKNLLAGNFTVRKTLFSAIGGYDENLKFGENTELMWRFLAQKPKISNISGFNFFYDNDLTHHSDRKKENQIAFTYYVLDKHKGLFKKKRHWTRIVCQIAGVNCLQLGRVKEGKKMIWKGYFSNPLHLKSLGRAIKYTFKF